VAVVHHAREDKAKTMTDDTKIPLFVYLLLDRSGSMESERDRTIDAVNEYVNGLKLSDELDATFSLTTFDSQSIDAVIKAKPVSQALALTRETYVPRASTPLLDAVGRAVSDIDDANLKKDHKVALVIVTDGLENASTEYKKETIRKLLEGRQKDKGWLITFLGADIDAFAESGQFGLMMAHTLSTSRLSLGGALKSTQALQERYAKSATSAPQGYTDEERRRAKT
jgi:uncharacterized protein YegL